MTVLNNPSIEFCRIENPARAIRFLEKVREKIGYFEDAKGDIIDLWFYSENEIVEWKPKIGKIIKTYRGHLVKEEKQEIKTRPPRIDKTYYPLTYYGLDTTRGNFLLLVGKSEATKTLFRLLRSNNFDVRRVGLGRVVQDKLCVRKDMFYYASAIDDEIEDRAGKLKVTSSSTDTPLKGVDIDRLIDQRGRNRDQGITWKETNVRPKVVFWINREGRLYVKRPEFAESFFLQLIDIIIGVL